jgi:hypothetical protein
MAMKPTNTQINASSIRSGAQYQPTASSATKVYEIHIEGHLDKTWSEWLDGLEVQLLENGETILSGPIVDQSALLGVLNKLGRMNVTLISLNEIRNEEKK